MLSFDDVERILGERPFTSTEMRNIDRLRHGFKGKPEGKADGDARYGFVFV